MNSSTTSWGQETSQVRPRRQGMAGTTKTLNIYIYILISHHKDLENIMTMTVLQLSLSAQCHLPIKAVANAHCYPRLDKEKPVWPLLWWDEQVSRHLLSFPRAIPSANSQQASATMASHKLTAVLDDKLTCTTGLSPFSHNVQIATKVILPACHMQYKLFVRKLDTFRVLLSRVVMPFMNSERSSTASLEIQKPIKSW